MALDLRDAGGAATGAEALCLVHPHQCCTVHIRNPGPALLLSAPSETPSSFHQFPVRFCIRILAVTAGE
jgi:hypothetical protein